MKRNLLLASAFALAIAGFSVADTAGGQAQTAFMSSLKAGTPTRMIYELDARANILFIPATGRASFNAELRPDNYLINSRVKVTGIADWFVNYNLTLSAAGATRGTDLKTKTYVSHNRDGKKNRRVELAIGEGDFRMTANPAFGNLGDPAATAEQVIQANDPVTALITFALEPRAPGADPCGGPMRIFDGRQLTHLYFKNAGTRSVKSPAWSGKAIECHVTMDKVAGYKAGEVNNDTLTGINGPLRMWLAPMPNGTTVPVRIEADTDKIGKVVLQARTLRFEPLTTSEAATPPRGG